MRDFKYTIGVDTDEEEQAIAEATHRLASGAYTLAEYGDYTGELPVLDEFREVEAIESEAGPAYAVRITVNSMRKIPLRLISGAEMVERV